ncbi:hypothetical protein MBLNU459_g7469t1 [Dothideomycetes sp. NU459]
MPLLSRRRSTLDLLLNDVRNVRGEDNVKNHSDPAQQAQDALPAPTAHDTLDVLDAPAAPAALSDRRLSVPRPVTEHHIMSSPDLSAPDSPPFQHPTPATRRFSMLRWRHFSDTQLATRARLQAESDEKMPIPDIPTMSTGETARPVSSMALAAPQIITTAPTMDLTHDQPSKRPMGAFKRQISRLSPSKQLQHHQHHHHHDPIKRSDARSHHVEDTKHFPSWRRSFDKRERTNDLHRLSTAAADCAPAPPAYGDDSNTALALPAARLSDSSGGDRSSGEHVTYASTTTTHTISTTTTLFKLPRRNKKKSLFPLPPKAQLTPDLADSAPDAPRASTSAISTRSNVESLSPQRSPLSALQRRHTDVSNPRLLPSPSTSPTRAAHAKSSVAFAAQGAAPLLRNNSTNSIHSARSSSVLAPPRRLGLRDRSSTMSSFGRLSDDATPPTPPTIGSARNSTSTSGRTSLGGFLSLNRFRHGSDPQNRQSSPGTRSKSNSFAISREALVVPEREEGDTPSKYLERLQATVSRSLIAGILSKSSDPFAQSVLRSYCRRFAFFGEPIDMSLRKFLLEAELPKETQQVDRVIQAFADRYHECNPGIFTSPDQAYIVAFSLMMLHTDAFNKNNKRKMQKQDYIKNTSGQNVSDDVLACFYDNICYTPFIHFDEEVDINGERLLSFKPKKSKLKGTMPDPVRKNSGPIDPYALICDGKLDALRPSFKDTITMEDPYSYLGTARALDLRNLQRAFVNTGILQIISARSRPAAFESQATRDNPNEAPAGLVDLKITKVGLLWRKATKRKKARSPWQEWGAILTGSQLYLFKNITWMKSLMAQQHAHEKQGSSSPVIFKPAIQEFKPDALIKTDDAVALLDASYNKHKDAFTIVRHGGQEEILLAENESEMNDWIALINYAAAFRSAGVRIRGFIGGSDHDSNPRSLGRMDSTASIQTSTGPVEITQKQSISPQLARQVMAARRQIMLQTVVESDREITDSSRNLDNMLRNARHLAILAPIQPKTREGVVHAAARMDAMLKWVRRDIWRTKCHRDILALDLEENGESADKVLPSLSISPPPAGTVRRISGIQRLSSRTTVTLSPPQSPQSPIATSGRPRTMSSTEGFLSGDVFKTPPEHAQQLQAGDSWTLPPLDMDVAQSRSNGGSAAQTMPRKHSTAGQSSTSSMQEVERHLSTAASDTPSRPGQLTPTPSHESREREALALARDGLTQTITATTASSASASSQAYNFASTTATPESSSKIKSGRRSLHRTLRDRDHEPSSIHRHRRGKESSSTVRSEGGDELVDGTPRLERTTGKFLVHGKQASVITFGGDWAKEKSRLERKSAARSQAQGNAKDADESGPEANLRLHVTAAADDDMAGYITDSTAATAESRRPSHADAFSLGTDHQVDTAAARALEDASIAPELLTGGFHQYTDTPIPHPDHQQTGTALGSSDEEAESYFDVGSPQSSTTVKGKAKSTKTATPQRVASSGKQELEEKTENVSPAQMPLPSSPNINDDDHTIPFPRYIGDEELRQLSSRPQAQVAET